MQNSSGDEDGHLSPISSSHTQPESLQIRHASSQASQPASTASVSGKRWPSLDAGGTGKGNGKSTGNNGASRHHSTPETISTPRGGMLSCLFGPGGALRPFRLWRQDARNLKSRWLSDWAVFNQLVVASAVYVFFTNILPGITFASDLYVLTGQTWGTIEVVFSTGLCGIVFAVFSAQPLTILGVTGPFSVLAENIYKLCESSFHVDFLHVMAWSLIHAGWMHILLAAFNAHDYTMGYVTQFSADIFSLLNSVIYFHKAALGLSRTHGAVSFAAFLWGVIGAVGTCVLAIFLSTANSWRPLFHRYVRLGLAEYAAAISIILFTGLPHIGELGTLDHEQLMVQTEFRPSSPDRSVFFVRFWELPVGWIFASIVPGAIITALFYFDHEISSIICTVPKYGVRKPGGYAWDIVLLGLTTAVCGILGIPPSNGLLPQAPLHSESLLHTVYEPLETNSDLNSNSDSDSDSDSDPNSDSGPSSNPSPSPNPSLSSPTDALATRHLATRLRVHEQRYSHLLQAALILCFVSPPLQRLLGLTPTSVLAGLFVFMGYQSLRVNPILGRLANLVTPPSELPKLPRGATWWGTHTFTATQVVATGLVFGITLTVTAPAFPVVIMALVPVRLLIMNRIWGRETLRHVDRWACREGTPEDDDDDNEREKNRTRGSVIDEEKGRVEEVKQV